MASPRRRPAVPDPTSDATPDVPSSDQRPLVGRDAELQRLRAAVASAQAGRGQAVLVLGDAGMGKTRLLDELDRSLPDDVDVAWGRAWRPDDAPAFWPWVQVLRRLARGRDPGQLAPSRHAAAIVGRVVPELQEQLGVPAVASDPVTFEILDALASVILHATAVRPAVLLLDDLHDADEPSLELLTLLAGEAWTSSLAIIACSRPTSSRVMSDVAARSDVLTLRGLDDDGVAALARASGTQLEGSRIRRLRSDTGGNPFLVLESMAATSTKRGAPTSPGMRGLVESRIRDLSPPMVTVVTATAVLDDEADEGLLAAMLDREPMDVIEDLKTLADLDLVQRDRDRPTGWAVRHDLLREALLERCEESTRRRLEEAAGRALAQRYRDDATRAAVVGHHLAAAVPIVPAHEAAAVLRRAARDATRRLSHEEAARHLTVAAGLLRTEPDREGETLDTLLELGHAQLRGTAPASARATLAEAIDLGRRVGDAVRLARAVLWSCDAARRAPGFDMDAAAVVPDIDDALAAIASAPDPEADTLRAQLLATRGVHLTMAGESAELGEVAAEATEAAVASGDARAIAMAALCLRGALGPWASLDERRRATAELLEGAIRAADLELLWRAHRHQLVDALAAADPVAAAAAVDACTEVAARMREPYVEGLSLLWQGTLALLQGRFDDHAAITERALEAMQRAEGAGAELLGGQQLFRARDLGVLDTDGLDALAVQYPTTPVIQAVRIWGHLHVGSIERAGELLDEMARAGLEQLPRNNFWIETLAMLAEVASRLARHDVAATLLRLLAPLPDQCVLAANGPVAWTGPLSHFTGLLRLTTGDVPGAVADLERALDIAHRMGARPAMARTRTALAVARTGTNMREAGDELRRAHDEAGALGMSWLVGEQDRIVDRFRVDLSVPAPAEAETGATAPRRTVLRPSADGWEVGVDDRFLHVRGTKGLHYLATLVAHPRREIPALELASPVAVPSDDRGMEGADLTVRLGGGSGPVLDEQAIAAYRQRLEELEVELEEADQRGDVARATAAGDERDALVEQLTAGVGLGGRPRYTSDDAEKARINVTRAIRTAIDRIRVVAPDVADHLDTSVQTGRFCSYAPDPTSPIEWDVRP